MMDQWAVVIFTGESTSSLRIRTFSTRQEAEKALVEEAKEFIFEVVNNKYTWDSGEEYTVEELSVIFDDIITRRGFYVVTYPSRGWCARVTLEENISDEPGLTIPCDWCDRWLYRGDKDLLDYSTESGRVALFGSNRNSN